MTREEEKLKAADEYVKSRIKQGQGMTGDVFPAFIEGAEWADETMIEKACKWLNAFLSSHYVMRYHDSCEPVHEWILEGFKKAMKE